MSDCLPLILVGLWLAFCGLVCAWDTEESEREKGLRDA